MSIFDYIFGNRKKSASVAKERLQIILAHEHGQGVRRDYLPELKQELLSVIAKYVEIDPEQINMQLEKKGSYEVLELNIVLPDDQESAG